MKHQIFFAILLGVGVGLCFAEEDPNLREIHALERMNYIVYSDHCQGKAKSDPECQSVFSGEGEEQGDQISTVAKLHDPRAVNALLGVLDTGTMAIDGLVLIGEPSFEPVLKVAKEDKDLSRVASALAVLAALMDERNLKKFSNPNDARRKAKEIFLKAQKSSDADVRKTASEGLETLNSGKSSVMDQPSLLLHPELATPQ